MGIRHINGKHLLNGHIRVQYVSQECIQRRCAKANIKVNVPSEDLTLLHIWFKYTISDSHSW